MSVYFDASVLVSMFLSDAHSSRADAYIAKHNPTAIVSSFARAEVASALGVKLRRREIDLGRARSGLAAFDAWQARAATGCEVTDADLTVAEAFLRRFDMPLRTADAAHLAIAARLGCAIATFDPQIVSSAQALGVALAPA